LNTRIKEIRSDANLSQEEFAKRLNISRGQVACYETGRRSLSNRTILDICDKFDINEEWLRCGEGPKKREKTEFDELAYMMGALFAEDNQFKMKIIKAMLLLEDEDWYFIEKLINKFTK
jgi:transcriptional regulator with XRE-family HTH domain